MSKLFASQNFEDELFKSMESTLVKSQVEDEHGLNKLAKAADFLNTAATIFEKAGMFQESEEITEILKKLVKDFE